MNKEFQSFKSAWKSLFFVQTTLEIFKWNILKGLKMFIKSGTNTPNLLHFMLNLQKQN